eukprot:TRINITY_DN2932_c0_g1_i1.p1 TRINITY_DN2932_c0_g1~~TRINITY_DN2932_c0_g1_i1.p1  ORF type:complete len:328 (-),score=59.47 TRINITY_DN2932_c0_g1_i1:46-1029(-)
MGSPSFQELPLDESRHFYRARFFTLVEVPGKEWSHREVELLEEALALQKGPSTPGHLVKVVQEMIEEVRSLCRECCREGLLLALNVLRCARSTLAACWALQVIEENSMGCWMLRDSDRQELLTLVANVCQEPWAENALAVLKVLQRQEILADLAPPHSRPNSSPSFSASLQSVASSPTFLTSRTHSHAHSNSLQAVASSPTFLTSSAQQKLEEPCRSTAPAGLNPTLARRLLPGVRLAKPQQRGKTLHERTTWPKDPERKLPLCFHSTNVHLHAWQPSFPGAQFAVPTEVNRPVGKVYFQDFCRPPSPPPGRPSFYGATQQFGHLVI